MLVSLALFFALLTPVVVVLLLLVAVGFALCGAAKQGDKQQDRYLADDLECKYALPACEGCLHTRDGAR
jgi:hypothetical protein